MVCHYLLVKGFREDHPIWGILIHLIILLPPTSQESSQSTLFRYLSSASCLFLLILLLFQFPLGRICNPTAPNINICNVLRFHYNRTFTLIIPCIPL